ncbi:hypothetical protein CcCBS67573_g04474 [Chytriomyces confervae]|uniref:Protein kinase domain-containing protein n=1 Tax=Chytriomyces confervae TaxID=246404 RepID=A0A507FG35_9FUNG|nr:hypothetical protein CcCBS67573_g04474 [Chytriomyces confervae]
MSTAAAGTPTLTEKQKEELNLSILDYLHTNGLIAAFEALRKETALVQFVADGKQKYSGLIEKKWTSVLRLSKKVKDLEDKLATLEASIPSKKPLTLDFIPSETATFTLTAHRGPIAGMVFHPLYSILATASEDASIKIFDFETGECERTLKGHTKAVNSVAFDFEERGSQLLASASSDLSIKIWDTASDYKYVTTGDVLNKLQGHSHKGHDNWVRSTAFHPNGKYLFTTGDDKTLRVWDLSKGRDIQKPMTPIKTYEKPLELPPPPPPPKPVSFLSAAIQQTQQKEQIKHQDNGPTREREQTDEWAVTSEPGAGIGLGLTPQDGDEKGAGKKEYFKKLATSKAPLRWTPDLNPISTATTFASQNQSNLNPNLNNRNMNSNSYGGGGYPNPSSPNPPLSPQHRHLHANTSSAANSIPASMYRRPSRSVSANTIAHPSSNSQSAAAWSNSTNVSSKQSTTPFYSPSVPKSNLNNSYVAAESGWPGSPSQQQQQQHGVGSFMSRSYASINNYQPSSSWIANGWGAVVPGTSVDDRGAFFGTTPGNDPEWRISNTPIHHDMHNTSDWRNSTHAGGDSVTPVASYTMPSAEWAVHIPSHQSVHNDAFNTQMSHLAIADSLPAAAPPHPDVAGGGGGQQQQEDMEPFDYVGNGRWKVSDMIGAGSFGQVFAAVDVQSGVHVAIKRELRASRRTQLPHEYAVYQLLKPYDGFPRIYYMGTEGEYNILVMERLGPSLKTLLKESPAEKIPLRTIVQMAPQMIRRLQSVHDAGVIFRDIKPDQFCIGRYNSDLSDRPTAYLIDFGLATAYRDAQGRHVKNPKPIKNMPKTGTARYASLNVHKGKHHSRRDDLESLGYMLVEAAKGPLPWTGIRAVTSTDGWRKIGICKDDLLIAELCDGLPVEFANVIEHARELRFAEDPDYMGLISGFVSLLMRLDEEDASGAVGGLQWRIEVPDDGYGHS